MILLATIFRLIDGLPLSASTDVVQRMEVKECQKYVKLISKKLYQLPDKSTLQLKGFHIHLISTNDISFVVLAEEPYSVVLAFSFLNEVQKEFLKKYNRDIVASIKRPYAFIEFDIFLQKTKSRYNSPNTLSSRLDLSLISTELKLRPAYQIREEDLYYQAQASQLYNDGAVSHRMAKSEYRAPVAPTLQLSSLSWFGWLSGAINVFCALLNLLRGMTIISHGHFDDEDNGAYRYGTCFLVQMAFCFYQVYLMFYFRKRRKMLSIVSCVVICVCQLLLFHLRNLVQVSFHLAANALATYTNIARVTQSKLPGYNV